MFTQRRKKTIHWKVIFIKAVLRVLSSSFSFSSFFFSPAVFSSPPVGQSEVNIRTLDLVIVQQNSIMFHQGCCNWTKGYKSREQKHLYCGGTKWRKKQVSSLWPTGTEIWRGEKQEDKKRKGSSGENRGWTGTLDVTLHLLIRLGTNRW